MKIITHNLPLKIASLLLAVGFWYFVALEVDKEVTRTVTTTAAFRGLKEGLTVLSPKDVGVTVNYTIKERAAGAITSDDVQVWVDSSFLRAGGEATRLPVKVTVPWAKEVQVIPAVLEVTVDRQVQREEPVSLAFEGALNPEKIMGRSALSPSRVVVQGPEALMDRLEGVQVVVDQSKFEYASTALAKPRLLGLGEEEAGLMSLQPEQVRVQVEVYEKEATRKVPVSVITAGSPAPGFRVADLEVTPGTVTVKGPQLTLRHLHFVETLPVKVEGIHRTFSQSKTLRLPLGVAVVGEPSLAVTVTVEPTVPSKVIAVPLSTPQGPPDPATVDLLVYAEQAVLDRLGPADFRIKLRPLAKGLAAVEATPKAGTPVMHVDADPPRVRLPGEQP